MNAASWMEGLPAQDRWRALALRDGPRLATWALGLAVAVQAGFIVTDLGGAGRTPHAAAPSSTFRPHVTDVAAITNAHLFGAAPAPKQDAANAPQTNMPLVLTGIIAANDPKNGLAILGPSAQTAKVYAVGDNVPGGAKVHSVYTDRVVIDRGGRLESLMLPRQAGAPAPAPSTAALQNESPVVERMRKALTEQPGLIADLLRPQAVRVGDKVTGFRVYPGRNRTAFARLGLRPGDEVVAINGTPLDDIDRGQEILRTLGSASAARVTVIRNNQQQDLNLNIAEVAQEAETATGLGQPQPPIGSGAPPGLPAGGMQPGPPPPPEPGTTPETTQ